MKNNGKGKFQKKNQKNSVFWVAVKKNDFFCCKNAIFWKNRQTLFVFRRGKKARIFVATICFGKMVLFLVAIPSHQTLQK